MLLKQNLYWKEASSSWYLAKYCKLSNFVFFKDSFPSSFEAWNLQREVDISEDLKYHLGNWNVASWPTQTGGLSCISHNQSSSALMLIAFLKGMGLVWNDSVYSEVPFIMRKKRTRNPPLINYWIVRHMKSQNILSSLVIIFYMHEHKHRSIELHMMFSILTKLR